MSEVATSIVFPSFHLTGYVLRIGPSWLWTGHILLSNQYVDAAVGRIGVHTYPKLSPPDSRNRVQALYLD